MKKIMSVFMVVVALAVLTIGSVFAYQSGNGNNMNSDVDKIAAEKAIESGDFATWKSLHLNSSGKMASLINEGNFYLLTQMHEAKEAGDFEKVQEIKSQIGFQKGNGYGNRMHNR
jgi:hypothetical protein